MRSRAKWFNDSGENSAEDGYRRTFKSPVIPPRRHGPARLDSSQALIRLVSPDGIEPSTY